ncbi:MAG: MOSC domain-containing protein [Solirubrobacteraceae bacterium]
MRVNVGRPREIGISRRGRPVISAIGKSPMRGRVAVRGVNLAGDEQADRRVHGGPDKAVYAYALEDTAWWANLLGVELGPGAFGENLTTSGVEVSGAVIGERWRIGSAELEVCQPRQPCYKLGLAFGDPGMVRRFAHAGRPGAYLRITREGELGAGDPVEILTRPDHGITIAIVARAIISDDGLLAGAASAPALPPALAAWMRERADSVGNREMKPPQPTTSGF